MSEPLASMSRFEWRLNVTMLSDWRVGLGAGRQGQVDYLTRRHPHDELPYIPAKTLVGIWRDACESVAAALDSSDKDSPWSCWVDVIFGSQPARGEQDQEELRHRRYRSRLTIGPARFPVSIAVWLRKNPAFRDALTFIKPGVRIDAKTGQAEAEMLRFEELVVAPTQLESDCQLDTDGLDDDQRETAEALLWAGLQVIERLGGKRRRGGGRCEIKMTNLCGSSLADTPPDARQKVWLNRLDNQPVECPIPRPTNNWIDLHANDTPASSQVLTPQDPLVSGWTVVPLELTLDGPVVIPLRVVGNVVQAADFIPGTALLGVITATLTKLLNRPITAEVARGDVRIRNAYLRVEEQRGRPVPRCFWHEKRSGGLHTGRDVWNYFAEPLPNPAAIVTKPHREGYLAVKPKSPAALPPLLHPPIMALTHATILDRLQRPAAELGGVYTYEALSPGSYFHTELWLRTPLADELSNCSGEWHYNFGKSNKGQHRVIRLGIAKKDDYGSVRLAANGIEVPPLRNIELHDGRFTLWLLADLLLRGDGLQSTPTVDSLRREVAAALDLPSADLVIRRAGGEANGDLLAAVGFRRSEGWNTNWQLPRPSYLGVAAGSCVSFEIRNWSVMDSAKKAEIGLTLGRLELEGLGERRAEGFGELTINADLLQQRLSDRHGTKSVLKQQQPDQTIGGPISSSNNSRSSSLDFTFARRIERETWRRSIRELCVPLAEAESRSGLLGWSSNQDMPPNSQLGALRAVVGRITGPDESGVQPLTEWVRHTLGNDARKKKWGKNSLPKLQKLIEIREGNVQTEQLWQHFEDVAKKLGYQPQNDTFPVMTEDGRRELKRELWGEALRSWLLTAIRMHIRDRERGELTGTIPQQEI